jgi:chorismate mutase
LIVKATNKILGTFAKHLLGADCYTVMKKSEIHITPAHQWLPEYSRPLVMAGPCSAETEEQVMEDARAIANSGRVQIFRAGIWKPRTRPNTFEGIGIKALPWLNRVQKETGLKTAIEVANAEHVQLALKYNIDMVWIGARTTVNPFSVQEIADALAGSDIPVWVKNPVSPDLNLWIGALERVHKAGITKLGAIHRGFSNYESTRFRNSPRWEIPIQLMTMFPDLPVVCDPSHISGKRDWVGEVAQKAMNLGMYGLMIETHPNPKEAWSDAEQQITPDELHELLALLQLPDRTSFDPEFNNRLAQLRRIIDSIDEEMVQILAKRMQVVEKIGEYKKENNVTIFQLERWNEIMQTRTSLGENLQLNAEFIQRILQEIHKESIQIQTEILNKTEV